MYLVVAGGGGGGGFGGARGGGGGAGGFRLIACHSISASGVPVTIGSGGSAGSPTVASSWKSIYFWNCFFSNYFNRWRWRSFRKVPLDLTKRGSGGGSGVEEEK
jgi:hypothetical protein